MKKRFPENMEHTRITRGLPPQPRGALYGAFQIAGMRVISSGTEDERWEHVSVSCPGRIPTWEEMCAIKNIFWDEEETVIQFHPKKSEYVNTNPNCLHLWKIKNHDFELPPRDRV